MDTHILRETVCRKHSVGRGGEVPGARIWLCRVKDLWDLLAGSLQAGRLGRSADKVSKGQGETEEIARPQTASLSWGGV